MKYLKTFEELTYSKTFEAYNDELILEKLNLQPLLNKFKFSINKKHVAKVIVMSLLSVLSIAQSMNFIQNRPDLKDSDKQILIQTINQSANNQNVNQSNTASYEQNVTSDASQLNLSANGLEHIKNHEKLRLTAYQLGYQIAVGYGHSEPISSSKYKVGDKISEEEANNFLKNDVDIAVSGVKRMFKQWKDQGVDIKMTQNQFDVIVSMAYNMGVGGFRKTEFVQNLKATGDTISAAKFIKTTGVSNKFPGLATRRAAEYEKFISV